MPENIYDLVPVLMCGMSWILCTLVSPNSWDHSVGLVSARKLHVVTCNFFRALWLLIQFCIIERLVKIYGKRRKYYLHRMIPITDHSFWLRGSRAATPKILGLFMSFLK